MNQPDVIIIGGGLAGLTAAIHLASQKLHVVLYEKDAYPHHKVCGEYLSNEILPYLNSLGVDLKEHGPVEIDHLEFSDHNGRLISTNLELGGIGISRHTLDHTLYRHAIKLGVQVVQDSVIAVDFRDDLFYVKDSHSISETNIVIGAFGKRSLLDKKLERDFISHKTGWLAVKGHYINKVYPDNTVSLHNFKGGYCGLSKTETGAVNVCYLATYKSFKNYKNFEDFKGEVLFKNSHLEKFFSNASPLFQKDISIAQISFDKKEQVYRHILMIGDAAGLIHPLCGNGMAMAIHSAKLASESILKNLNGGKFNRKNIERSYIKSWKNNFKSRMRMGRILQRVLMDPNLAGTAQKVIYRFPDLLPLIIKRTHGDKII